MKPSTYTEAIAWIGENDDPEQRDRRAIQNQMTVLLVADLVGLAPSTVARDVIKYRERAK